MARRGSLLVLFAATLLIAAAYASAFLPGGVPGWAPWVMALCTPAVLVAMMILGSTRRDGRVGRLAIPFAFSGVVLAGGFSLALGLPASEAVGVALYGGLPLRAAIIVYGIGLLPIIVLPIAYALTFESQTLHPGDVERVREAARAWRERDLPPAPTPSEADLLGAAR